MSRMYIHTRKYHRRNRRLAGFVGMALVISLIIVGVNLYSRYEHLNRTSYSTINNTAVPLTGYINPYFMFKDSAKWVQDKSQANASEVVYYQYVNGEAIRQLAVYINKVPTATQLASTRVLPVKVFNGDSLQAGSLSGNCDQGNTKMQQSVKEVSFAGITMVCDPSSTDYSVVLGEQGGSYELHMVKSKNPQQLIVLYKDFSGHPDAQTIINIANSFKVI